MEIFTKYNELKEKLALAVAIATQDLSYSDPRTRPGLENLKIQKKREVASLTKEIRNTLRANTLYISPAISNNEEFFPLAVELGCLLIDADQLYMVLAAKIDRLGTTFTSSHFAVMRQELASIFSDYGDKYDTSDIVSDPSTSQIGVSVDTFDKLVVAVKKSVQGGLVKDGLSPDALAKIYVEDLALTNAISKNFNLGDIGVLPVILDGDASAFNPAIVGDIPLTKVGVLGALKAARAEKFPEISSFFDSKEAVKKDRKTKQVKTEQLSNENSNLGETNE